MFCLDDLRLYAFFNSISVISGRCVGDNERLCAMESRLRLKISLPQAGHETGAARSVGQRLLYSFGYKTGFPLMTTNN